MTRRLPAFLIATLVGGCGAPDGAAPTAAGEAVVVEVVDGDTLVARFGADEEPLRLIGIDTPESVATDRPDECFGAEASAHLAELLPPGTRIRIERDVEPRDRYDRLLGYVHRTADDLFVNHHLVAHGFAEAKPYAPNTLHEPTFAAAESQARAQNQGLWPTCGSPDVPLPPVTPGP